MSKNVIIKAVLYSIATQPLWSRVWFWPTNCVRWIRDVILPWLPDTEATDSSHWTYYRPICMSSKASVELRVVQASYKPCTVKPQIGWNVLEIKQPQKMVLDLRKFEGHCFIIMATMYCLLHVKNYFECSPGLPHCILLANLWSSYSHYPHFAGKEHFTCTEPHSWGGSEPGLESAPFNCALSHCIPLALVSASLEPESLEVMVYEFFIFVHLAPDKKYRFNKCGLNESENVIGMK